MPSGFSLRVCASFLAFGPLLAAAEPTAIHAVQGPGAASPLAGAVVSVEGVVTGSFQHPRTGLGGFFIQTPAHLADSDPRTSEGLFVYDNGAPGSVPVQAGDLVRVTGTVVEFGTAPGTLTELTNIARVQKLGRAALPDAAVVSLPLPAREALETLEGMLVALPQTLTVTDTFSLGRHGELRVSHGRLLQPTNVAAPGGPAALVAAENARNLLIVDDGSIRTFPDPTPHLRKEGTVRVGDSVTGLQGVLTYSFGDYRVEPVSPVRVDPANPRTALPAGVPGRLRVAMSNVLNLFNGDGVGGGFPTSRGATSRIEYERQQAKIVAGLRALNADVIGLTEVENDGYGAESALDDLVEALNAGTPEAAHYVLLDASTANVGNDQIRVALVFRPSVVEPVGRPATLNHRYFDGVARPPLAQTFRERTSGEVFTVCVNHFRSKGSAATGAAADGRTPNPNLDQNDGQGNNNHVRTRQAQTLVEWLGGDPTGSRDPDVLIIGDLNAYAKEDPLTALKNAGYANLTEMWEGASGYSYVYQGQSGHLDHALASPALTPQVAGVVTWHVNADEPVYLDYNLEGKSPEQRAYNAGTPYRFSDHDPVLVGLNLGRKQ